MFIILEGPDGAGKSTLARNLTYTLSQRYSTDSVTLLHKGPPTLPSLEEYRAPLYDYIPGAGNHIVCDRWHVGELVYPPVLGRESDMSLAIFRQIEIFLHWQRAIIVHVTAKPEVLGRRLITRGDALIKNEMLPEILKNYKQALNMSILPVITTQSVTLIITRAEVEEGRSTRANLL